MVLQTWHSGSHWSLPTFCTLTVVWTHFQGWKAIDHLPAGTLSDEDFQKTYVQKNLPVCFTPTEDTSHWLAWRHLRRDRILHYHGDETVCVARDASRSEPRGGEDLCSMRDYIESTMDGRRPSTSGASGASSSHACQDLAKGAYAGSVGTLRRSLVCAWRPRILRSLPLTKTEIVPDTNNARDAPLLHLGLAERGASPF